MKDKGVGTSIIVIVVVAVVVVGGATAYMTLSNEANDTGEIDVSDLTLAKDMTENYEPIDETTVFSELDTVYLIGVINNPQVGMEVYSNWYDENGEMVHTLEDESFVIGEAHIIDGVTEIYTALHLAAVGLSPGNYSVELVIDNESIETLDFQIVAE